MQLRSPRGTCLKLPAESCLQWRRRPDRSAQSLLPALVRCECGRVGLIGPLLARPVRTP